MAVSPDSGPTGTIEVESGQATTPPAEPVASCPLCGVADAERLFPARDRLHRIPGEFATVRCRGCGLVRLSPRPTLDRLADYYPDDAYYSYQTPAYSVQTVKPRGRLQAARAAFRNSALAALGYPVDPPKGWRGALAKAGGRWFRDRALYGLPMRFPAFVPGGRALDIGCGNGNFLSYLKHHGWQVAGVELGQAAGAVARREFGIDVHVGPLEEAPFATESFDLIYMNHVIEHLPDPLATLRRAVGLLRPGGRFYIETPNFDSVHRAWCGSCWIQLDAPRHLVLFTPRTLRRLVEEAGLRVESMSSYPFRQIYHWEDTYRREERSGRALSPRPQLRARAFPRAAALGLVARLNRVRDPLGEDSLCCWSAKA